MLSPEEPVRRRTPRPRPVARPVERMVKVTLEADPRLVLSVVEAAQRIGIGRSRMYELIAAGEVESIHIGRLHKVPIDALADLVERQRAARTAR